MSEHDQSNSKRGGGALQLSPAGVPAFVRFRESHHAIARMFAKGLTVSKVSHETGYSRRRLHILLADPTFQELVVSYNAEEEQEAEHYGQLQISARNLAEMLLVERLQAATEEDGEPVSISILNKISQDRADRTGYSKHNVVRHELGFSEQLERAIARSANAKVINHEPKQIEARPSAVPIPSPDRPQTAVAEPRLPPAPSTSPGPSIARVLQKRPLK